MNESATEARLGKLETGMALMAASVDTLARNHASFQEEWRTKAEEDRKAHRSARLTLPQIAGLLFGAVSTTAILLGGLWAVISMQVGTAKSDLMAQILSIRQSGESAVAQVALSTRGQGEAVTAINTAIQTMQREQAADRVRLGLVDQLATSNSRFINQAQGFDAQMGRNDERLKALEQIVRDIAARRGP